MGLITTRPACLPACLPARPLFSFDAVFLDHLGIATVDFEFQEDAEAEYGVCKLGTKEGVSRLPARAWACVCHTGIWTSGHPKSIFLKT